MSFKNLLFSLILLVAFNIPLVGGTPAKVMVQPRRAQEQSTPVWYDIDRTFGQLPLSFEVRTSPLQGEAKAVSRSRGFTLFLAGNVAEVVIGKSSQPNPGVLQMQVRGGNPHVSATGIGRLRGCSNYLFGNDPGNWQVGVPNFASVLLHDIYPGIDMKYYGRQGDLEYDFIVAPGSDPRQIQLEFQGARQVRLATGKLVLAMADGELNLHQPVVYQVREGARVPVAGRFVMVQPNVVRFAIGEYDRRRPLIIDPGLVYSSYLGGSGNDEAVGLAVGNDGSAYLTGSTSSIDFPVTASGNQNTPGQSQSAAFVTKLNPAGDAIEYSTYVGGTQRSFGSAIAVNTNGEAYVTGSTYSTDFPITAGALQDHNAGGLDAFLEKLSADGSHLVYSTYLGGNGEDEAHSLALDAKGNVWVAGSTRSNNFPADTQASPVNCGLEPCRAAFVARINSTATSLEYVTRIGGSGETLANSVALDLSDAAYITGKTSAPDFPATSGAYQSHPSNHSSCSLADRECADVLVAKLSSQGAVLYATYIGGNADQRGNAIVVDDKGSAYVTGRTDSDNFPTNSRMVTSMDPRHTTTSFVLKLDPLGSHLEYSTFLGAGQESEGKAIALDSERNVYVAGWTSSPLFPTTANGFQISLNGKSSAFLSVLDERGAKLEYSSFISGSGSDVGNAVALDATGNIYVAGSTDSLDFPSQQAVQRSLAGERNAFVAKFSSISAAVGSAPFGGTTAPSAVLSASALQFLNQKPKTSSSAQTVKLTNSGTANLANIVVTVSGANATDFAVVTSPANNCGGTLAPSATCTLSVTFKPPTTGVQVAEIQVTDNASNSPQTVILTGNPPIASLSTSSLTFASQPEGSMSPYQTVTLKNSASYSSLSVSGISLAAGNFQQANNCPATLGAAATCSVTVAFGPGATGTLNGNLIFSDNSLNNTASQQTVLLDGTATGAPVASLSATSIDFGTLPQGTKSGIKTITLTNTGVGSLTISNLYLTAADSFILSTGTGACSVTPSLAAGSSCTIGITFYANAGIQTSTILLTTNSGNLSGTVQEISLVGTGALGTYSGQFSDLLLNFGSVAMGATGIQKTVQFTNTGTLPLSIGANSLFNGDSQDYQVQPAPANGCGAITLAAGASCNVLITFQPALGPAGVRSAIASITISAPYLTQAMYLIGTATGQSTPTLSATGLTFGTVQVGSTSVAQTIVLQNTGNEPMTSEGLSVSGADFAVVPVSSNNCPPTGGMTLAPKASCNIGVVFQPTTAGTLSELLTVNVNPGNGAYTTLYVALTGNGQSTTSAPTITMSANTLQFGNQLAGTVSPVQSITLTNTGTIPWYISTFSTGAYVMESLCNSYVSPGGSCVVNVYFAPTALGPQSYSASLQVLTSASSSYLSVVFNGTGSGTASAKVSKTTLNLGTAISGSVGSSKTVIFTNTGNVPYPLGSVGINELNAIGSSPDFQQTNNCQFAPDGMMPVGATCTVVVTYTPSVGPAGIREALLTFQQGTTAVALQSNVILSGTAEGTPVISVSPLSLTFLDQSEGTSSLPVTLTISNTGSAPLPFNVTLGGGEFPMIAYDCPSVLEPRSSCNIYFAFFPSSSPSFETPRVSNVIVPTGFTSQMLIPMSGFGTPAP